MPKGIWTAEQLKAALPKLVILFNVFKTYIRMFYIILLCVVYVLFSSVLLCSWNYYEVFWESVGKNSSKLMSIIVFTQFFKTNVTQCYDGDVLSFFSRANIFHSFLFSLNYHVIDCHRPKIQFCLIRIIIGLLLIDRTKHIMKCSVLLVWYLRENTMLPAMNKRLHFLL